MVGPKLCCRGLVSLCELRHQHLHFVIGIRCRGICWSLLRLSSLEACSSVRRHLPACGSTSAACVRLWLLGLLLLASLLACSLVILLTS